MTDTGTSVSQPHVKVNKWWLIGGGIALGGVYYVYKRRAFNTATNTASTVSSSAIDPATGIPYVDEANYSSGAVGSPYSALSGLSYNASTGQYQPINSTTSVVPSDNQTWAQKVTNYLVSVGFDQTAVTDALGLYLGGNGSQGATQSQLNIIHAAKAYGGTPPVGVPDPQLINNAGQATAPVQAVADGFYRILGSSTVYQVASGTAYPISLDYWNGLGNPAANNVGGTQADAILALKQGSLLTQAPPLGK